MVRGIIRVVLDSHRVNMAFIVGVERGWLERETYAPVIAYNYATIADDYYVWQHASGEKHLLCMNVWGRRLKQGQVLLVTFEDAPASSTSDASALHGAPEFISWTWEMINGGHADIGWSHDGKELVVRNPERLTREVFPQFFRHTQYSSFVRALDVMERRRYHHISVRSRTVKSTVNAKSRHVDRRL